MPTPPSSCTSSSSTPTAASSSAPRPWRPRVGTRPSRRPPPPSCCARCCRVTTTSTASRNPTPGADGAHGASLPLEHDLFQVELSLDAAEHLVVDPPRVPVAEEHLPLGEQQLPAQPPVDLARGVAVVVPTQPLPGRVGARLDALPQLVDGPLGQRVAVVELVEPGGGRPGGVVRGLRLGQRVGVVLAPAQA